MTVKIDVDFHEESLYETKKAVNFW
jgi:hypothetical protein